MVLDTDGQLFSIQYADFWNEDGGGLVKGLFSTIEEATADGILSLDELVAWNLDWTGNASVEPFSISSADGSAIALTEPGGFKLNGENTAFTLDFSDADGLDQGLYESDSGEKTIDLGGLIIEDIAAETASEGNTTAGSISISEVIDFEVDYSGFWRNEGSVQGTFSIREADVADGVASLNELVSWSWAWTGNSDVAAFSLSSEEGSVTALVPPGGFKLNATNTAVDSDFVDADGLDQGLFESASGDQYIDLGALIVEDLAAGTVAEGEAAAANASIALSNNFSNDLVIGLYNSRTDQLIQVLEEGDPVSIDSLDFDHLNIAAFVVEDGALAGKVGSMQALLNGEVGTDYFENVKPYALFGDSFGDYFAGSLSPGEQTVSFKVYSESQGEGEVLATVDRTFTIEESMGSGADDFTIGLYHSETDQLIQILEEGDTLSASELDLDKLNVAAFVDEQSSLFDKVGSMQVLLNGQTGTDYFENFQPYALFGDSSGDYFQGALPAGANVVAFEVYSGQQGQGELLTTIERSFTLV